MNAIARKAKEGAPLAEIHSMTLSHLSSICDGPTCMNTTTYYDSIAEINGRNLPERQYVHQLNCNMHYRLRTGKINHGCPRPVAPMVNDGKEKMVVGGGCGEGGATIEMGKKKRQKFTNDAENVSEESEDSGNEGVDGGRDGDGRDGEEDEWHDGQATKRRRNSSGYDPMDILNDKNGINIDGESFHIKEDGRYIRIIISGPQCQIKCLM